MTASVHLALTQHCHCGAGLQYYEGPSPQPTCRPLQSPQQYCRRCVAARAKNIEKNAGSHRGCKTLRAGTKFSDVLIPFLDPNMDPQNGADLDPKVEPAIGKFCYCPQMLRTNIASSTWQKQREEHQNHQAIPKASEATKAPCGNQLAGRLWLYLACVLLSSSFLAVCGSCLAGRLWLLLACVVLFGSFLAVSGLYLLGGDTRVPRTNCSTRTTVTTNKGKCDEEMPEWWIPFRDQPKIGTTHCHCFNSVNLQNAIAFAAG